MNKLELLFDGTTIINFSFIAKLFKRYLKSSIAIMAIIFCLCVSFYFLQEDIYWTSISFSDATEDKSDGAMKSIASLTGEKKGGIRATDILNLRSSIDFNRKIAQELISSEFYSKLRFDLNILSFHSLDASDLEKHCRLDKNCIVEELVKRLPKFYQITDKDRSGVNFIVEVKALDILTANVLLKSISKAILDTRTDVVRFNLKDQEKANTTMLIEKKKEVDVASFYELQEERDRLDSELKEVQSKLDHQVNIITSVQDNLANAESTYQRSLRMSNKKVDYDSLDVELHRKELQERIEKLNSDLIALEDVSVDHSIKDKEIISQIKKEINESKKKLTNLGEGNSQTNLKQFVKLNDEKLHNKELDYKVVKDQLSSAKLNYEELIIKKKDIVGKKIKTEQSIEILKPSIEFVKNLEIKIEQLKLSSTSVSPDVRFDSYAAAPEPAKKIGLILMVGYLVILEGLILTMFLAIRFYFDGHIYDLDDLKSISSNLKIIGNGPSYK